MGKAGYKLLIVDDEALMREGLKVYIDWKLYGIGEIFTAGSGECALDIARTAAPELIVTDIRMPGMNGLDLIAELNKLLPESVIIINSGYDDFKYAQRGMELGTFHYLIKPINVAELTQVVGKATDHLSERGREKEQKQSLVENSKSAGKVLIKDFLSALILQKRRFSQLQIDERAKKLGIPLSFPNYTCCVTAFLTGEVPSAETASDEIADVLEQSMNAVFAAQDRGMRESGFYQFSFVDDDKLIAVFCSEKNYDMEEILQNAYGEIAENIGCCFPIKTTMALGPTVFSLNDLCFSYLEAEKTVSYYIFIERAGFFSTDSFASPNLDVAFLISSGEKQSLLAAIEQSDLQAVGAFIDTVGIGIQDLVVKDREFLFSVVMELSISAARLLEQRHIHFEQYFNPEVFTYEFFRTFKTAGHMLQWFHSFLSTIADVLKNEAGQESEAILVKQIKEYVSENLFENINLYKTAQRFHYNSHYIGRLFKKSTGYKFSEYLNAQRIERACRLLKGTGMSVEDVAMDTGYNDSQYFIRTFKRHMGITPKKYRGGT